MTTELRPDDDISKEGANPYAADAAWISNGGYDRAIQLDIAAVQHIENPAPAAPEAPAAPAAPQNPA